MEHFNGSDYPPVYHGAGSQRGEIGSGGDDLSRKSDPPLAGEDLPLTREDVRALAGGLPRMFALVQETGEDDEEIAVEVVAYGLALPCGTAATVGVVNGFGRWTSAHSAASRLRSDLVWLGDDGEWPSS
ncbi:hypothetical protein [Streptosporangium minutum]|uniref:Uncharacterized protein n=1 Tax=Streptosporangium minutum TaxID=569862 RepID=A0A243RSK5_9ACTN|nr:hypothetical protein [Streptosporangium minutum]OUC98034.1 hypothetical protein CA984_08845 [Streptosporangium minutum]